MIGRLIQTFTSAEIAIDDRHTPRLHARFLSTLLSRHRKDVSSASRPTQQQPPQQSQSVAGGSSGTHASSASPDPGASSAYQTSPQGQSQQPPPGTTGMSQGQPPMYSTEGYEYSTGPSQPQGPQYGAEPMEGFDDELLGALQVLKTPGYWQTMMMPGYVSVFVHRYVLRGYANTFPSLGFVASNGLKASQDPALRYLC